MKNPYDSPTIPLRMSQEYYTTDLTKIPFRLASNALRSLMPMPFAIGFACFFLFRRIVRWRFKATCGRGPCGSGHYIDLDEIPPRIAIQWTPYLNRIMELGFHPVYFRMIDTIGSEMAAIGILLDAHGTTLAVWEWTRMLGPNGTEEHAGYEFHSYFEEDPQIATLAVKGEHAIFTQFASPCFCNPETMNIEIPIASVYERHLERIQGRAPLYMTHESSANEYHVRCKRRFEFMLAKGILRKLSVREVTRIISERSIFNFDQRPAGT